MGERKVLNKYYPPDFDPAKIPRRKRPHNEQMKIRMMLPMSIRCNTCGNYIYKGTKFNSRKEDAVGEGTKFNYRKEDAVGKKYLGIQIFRFYFKCTRCSAELAIKTDPQNSDYTVESGASRNYEPWRNEDEQVSKEQQKREAEEMGDAMKSLENRTLDSKREMDILAALDEVKSMKSRHAVVSMDALLDALQKTGEEKEKKLEDEDEALIKSLFGKPRIFHTIDDDDLDDDYYSDDDDLDNGQTSTNKFKRSKLSEDCPVNPTDYLSTASDSSKIQEKPKSSETKGNGKFNFKSPMVTISVVKKQPPKEEKKQEVKANANLENTGLHTLLQSYGSDDESDS